MKKSENTVAREINSTRKGTCPIRSLTIFLQKVNSMVESDECNQGCHSQIRRGLNNRIYHTLANWTNDWSFR